MIFGWDSNYDEIVVNKKMTTLHERREALTLGFARKTSKNKRFENWFKEKEYGDLNLRTKKKYEENFARTERLKNSPVYYMRRKLNED